jgi:3-oxoacyl-[acyl-carrier protein] reductase
MKLSLEGKHAVVCGSSQGIGKAIAKVFAEMGASVTLVARNSERLKAALTELSTSGAQKHACITADFEQPHVLEEAIKKELRHPVHILVNNTGGPAPGLVQNSTVEEYRVAFNAHVICSQILVQAVLPDMKKAKWGRIINLTSTAQREPIVGLGVSGTIRGAMAAWSKMLSKELAPFGITVNNVLPGSTNTQRMKQLNRDISEKMKRPLSEIDADTLAKIPMGRLADPMEIAHVAGFLASDQASYVTGVSIPVDGGRSSSL